MWQTDWAEHSRETAGAILPEVHSQLALSDVASVYLLQWNEHCVECAVPDCYRTCPLYVQRRDRKCARFRNGIFPNPRYRGLFSFGAEIEFRRWGKLESTFGFGALTPGEARLLARLDRACLRAIRPISRLVRRLSPYYRLQGAYAQYRDLLLRKVAHHARSAFDDFVVEAWNFHSESVPFVIEAWQEGPRFRTSIRLEPGRGTYRIPVASMNIDLYGPPGRLQVYPDQDAEARVAFGWLDIVHYARPANPTQKPISDSQLTDCSKIKCVIWDLDNTVWVGILGEKDSDEVSLRPGVFKTMLALDEKGILQSIASKNDHDHAWRAVRRLGIDHLFVQPAINWEPKSVTIQRIAESLNVGIDACALVDDSAFERAEVASRLPGIRTYSNTEAATLLQRPEFQVPVTDESRRRRHFYAAESERKRQAYDWGGDYETFLRTCNMQARLFTPVRNEHVERCLELLHRSNQLNLSSHRYLRKEFTGLLASPDTICVCTSCRDRFGDYGVVGFASLERHRDELLLTDFVLSCRVAQKKVEHAWFSWLTSASMVAGYGRICARYVKSSRNGVLLVALKEVGFVESMTSADSSCLELKFDGASPAAGIVSIDASQIKEFPACAQFMGSAAI